MSPLYLTVNFINHYPKNISAVSIPIVFKWEHRRILEIIVIVDADFVNSALFIFTRAKHMVLTVQGQRMWNVAFVTISPTHTKLHLRNEFHFSDVHGAMSHSGSRAK